MDDFGYEPRYGRLATGAAGEGGGGGGEEDGQHQSTTEQQQQQQQQQQRQRQQQLRQKKIADAMAKAKQKTGADDRIQVRPGSEPEDAVPLPQAFTAQYLGSKPAGGLWGVRHTRKPVDELVNNARTSPGALPFQRLRVSATGVDVFAAAGPGAAAAGTGADQPLRHFDIGSISYGVQDLVYTRVFCFIVVTEPNRPGGYAAGEPPVFHCHAYVCESRAAARALTHALAAAFRAFSRELRRAGPGARELVKKKFKIDLRPPEQLAADLALGTHADSSDA